MIRTLSTNIATRSTTSSTSAPSVKTTPTLIPATSTTVNIDSNIMQPIKGQNESTTTTTQSSSIHCASLTSTSQTVNTVSTNNTMNSLNHNVAGLQNNVMNNNNCGNNENSIPSGYSVHIKASNNQSNNGTTTTNMAPSNNIAQFSSTVSSATNTSNSSAGSSPTPNSNAPHSSAGSFSTATTSSTAFNQLPTLASSDSLSAFNFFDGLTLPSAPTVTNSTTTNSSIITPSTTSQSPLTTALFNTNPPPTTNALNPLTSNNIVTDETVAQIVSNTSVPEFLYQLTKMLTDDHRDIIEWSNGKIEVHNPTKLEKEVLNQYFRHSKYASFQRQLNYFGFRKLAGKGKMAPCSYVNENATSDLRSLLRMKRKTSANAKDGKAANADAPQNLTNEATINKPANGRSQSKKTSNKRARTSRLQIHEPKHPYEALSSSSGITIAKKSGIRHQLNNFGNNNTSSLPNYNGSSTSQISSISNPLVPDPMTSLDPVSIAKAAVGKGVTHQYQSANNHNSNNTTNKATNNIGISNSVMSGIPTDSSNKFTFLDPSQLGMGIESCLSELQTNFRNSLNEANAQAGNTNDFNNSTNQLGNQDNNQCTMQRESSLVDLAIIPSLSSALPQAQTSNTYTGLNNKSEADYGMTFIDFPMDNAPLAPPEE